MARHAPRRWVPPEPPKWTLEDGVRLSAIYLPDGGGYSQLVVGSHGFSSITVQHEAGQMAPVPWARVLFFDGRVILVNLASVESVAFSEPFPADNGADEDGGGE